MNTTSSLRLLPLLLCASLLACSSDQPTSAEEGPVAAKPEPLEPLPALRIGTRTPNAADELVGTLAARSQDRTHEYLDLILPAGSDLASADRLHVELTASSPGDLAVVAPDASGNVVHVLVRRHLGTDAGLSGALFVPAWSNSQSTWQRVPFRSQDGTSGATDQSLQSRWVAAFAAPMESGSIAAHPWLQFAAGRVHGLLPGGVKAAAPSADGPATRARRTELAQLMETTTGALSMQEALQYDRGLRLDRTPDQRSLDIASLALPALDAHPFAAMQAKLPKPDGATPEPLAAAVPAEFWYVRVDDIRLLLRLLDEADAWITPVVQILQSSPEDRRLSERYQAQLGLRRSGLAKLFGNAVVGQVAITGSDPYLREGSDVTLIFSVKQQAIFDQELARHLADYQTERGELTASTRDYAGVSISVHRDANGSVRQQRAQIGELAIVSNSPRACERVIDAIQGKTPRLADEPDLKYLLARDPGSHQALAFASDKFIAAVIGPQQKVLAARRAQALAELMTPGYAALLHGWLYGRAPASTQTLVASGLLEQDELKHSDGAAIDFAPGGAARSSWGTVAALTPMIDLPAVTTVSEAEKSAYTTFVSGYQQYWKQFIDPAAVRLDLRDQGGATRAVIDVRILPLISGTEYSEIKDVVGTTRVQVQALDRGIEAVWAVGPNARLRTELDGLMHSATGQQDIGIGWLGDWVSLGLDDRATLVELLSRFDHSAQLPDPNAGGSEFEDLDLWQRVGKFPIYAAAEVKNPAMLIATLAAIRTMLGQVAPQWIDWREAGTYRDLGIVRVGVSKSAPGLPNPAMADAVALHYVQTGKAFVLALNVETLHAVVDRLLDGKAPKSAPDGQGQLVYEARSRPGAPLWTALLWLIQGQAYEAQDGARRSAEILLRGDPATTDADQFAARALAYFGYVPLTPQGDSAFVLRGDGAGDAISGTTIAPNYVELPIKGSPVERLMQRLTGVRSELSFDAEPDPAGSGALSLHTRFELNLGTETVE